MVRARLGRARSCDSTTIGMFSSFASPFSDREIDASSSVRFSIAAARAHQLDVVDDEQVEAVLGLQTA